MTCWDRNASKQNKSRLDKNSNKGLEGQHGDKTVRAKRYGAGTVKTVRGRYGQNGMGPVRAKRYGAGTGKTVWGRYGARCGRGVGPARFPVCSPYGKYTCPLRMPLPPIVGRVGTACTMPVLAPYGHVYWEDGWGCRERERKYIQLDYR